MPLIHCKKCHHEWETGRGEEYSQTKCDWCGAEGYILVKKTSFEKFMEHLKMNWSKIIDQFQERKNSG